MRGFLLALATLASACSPPAQQARETPGAPQAISDEAREAALAVLTPVISQSIGQPVSLNVTSFNIDGEAAWVVAQPRTSDGGAIDWSATSYATQAREGVLDGDGTTYALLKRENGQWRVVEHVIGPTDVAWYEWPSRHDVSPELLGLPTN
jgi:hypothetical protein